MALRKSLLNIHPQNVILILLFKKGNIIRTQESYFQGLTFLKN